MTEAGNQIYLDYNASTPIDPRVARAMRELPDDAFGNPSSVHWAGTPGKSWVESARKQVADLLGCAPGEIVFTSGASESNNLAIKGLYYRCGQPRPHLITTQIEHPAIIEPCRFLERQGAQITWLPVDRSGRVNPDDVRSAITPQTILVSVMHANGEVGTIQPIPEIAGITREHGIPLHTDAAQSVGKIPTRIEELGVDMLTVAGHKMYAPKGIGALYVREGIDLEPLIHGAGHELGRRAGTESALMTVALGEACRLAGDLSPLEETRRLRDRFWELLQTGLGDRVVLNGHATERLPNTLHVSFVGKVGGELLATLPDVAAATGSACHSGSVELSPVLRAMGVPGHIGAGAVRFSLGRATTIDEIESVAERILQRMNSAD